MEAKVEKKAPKINKNGWLPVLVISGGLVLLIIVLKLIMSLLGNPVE
ncbi:MAG: hypothetical protein JXB00_12455 [Bacteroidales bacterium]|nr:hypothetical protein [Bacteroidales bacterium]